MALGATFVQIVARNRFACLFSERFGLISVGRCTCPESNLDVEFELDVSAIESFSVQDGSLECPQPRPPGPNNKPPAYKRKVRSR